MALFGALLATLLLFAPAVDFLAEGMKALDANQPAAAEPALRQAVAADAEDVPAHFNLALALSLQQKDEEAIAEFQKTLALAPGLYQANLNLGLLLLRNKRPAEAAPVLKAALEARAPDARVNTARPNLYYAQALFETGDFYQAEGYFRAASEADPKLAEAQAGLARCLVKNAKLAEADDHFRQAAKLDPGYSDALLELAPEYEKAGRAADAMEIYRQFPGNATARERLAALRMESKDFASAIPVLEATLKAAPSVANRLALADAYKMNRQPAKAVEQLQAAVMAEPSNFELRMYLGRELRDAHSNIPAAREFLAATRIRPDAVQAWNELASILIVNENYAEGLDALEHVRALGKEIPGDMYYRAITLDKLKRQKPAVEAYRQFLAADGGRLPDQEFLARQRIRIIESELNRK